MQIISYKNFVPKIAKTAFIASGAKIIGDVEVGENSSVWFNSTVRGDVAPITIGSNTNIQDNSVIHTSRFNDGRVDIGSNVTIGHMSLIHACHIMNNAFIGMGAIIMDKAIVEEYAFIAANSLVTERKVIKSRQLWMGSPAKFIRELTDQELSFIQNNADNYVMLAREYL